MTSKSKNKGNSLERDVRDSLNNAFKSKEFARTPSSGAIMGLSNAEKNAGLESHTKQTLGSDIICPSWFKWSIECKNYANDPNYSKLIKEDDRVLNGWLGEALYDAISLQLIPLLVFKTTRKGTYVAIMDCFTVPQQITHYATYDGFFIFNFNDFIENIRHFNDENNDNFESFYSLMTSSERYKFLIETMLKNKRK